MIEKLLIKACSKGMLKLAAKCLEHGANLTFNDKYALQAASYNGHVDIVKLLLEYGADPTEDDSWAIKWASFNKHVEIVEILKNNLTAPKN